jgi:hypothetical protein
MFKDFPQSLPLTPSMRSKKIKSLQVLPRDHLRRKSMAMGYFNNAALSQMFLVALTLLRGVIATHFLPDLIPHTTLL